MKRKERKKKKENKRKKRKKQKEEEKRKEEEEKQRKADKKKEMFKGFFIQKEPTVSPPKVKEMKNGLFMPFELKPNMKLAPSRRSPLSNEAKHTIDECMEKQDCKVLYLKTVKTTTLGKSFKTWPKRLDIDEDIEILSHEKETIEKVTYRAKFLYFHENTRPAYYGTWRKQSKSLSARNPFKQDEDLFDYEVESDDEWEEEEPGESVSSDEEGEDEGEKVEDEDPEGDDWMVPHGYLSDGEGVEEDEEVDMASKQDLQKVRQAAWESELKRQAKPLKMLAIGCAWENDETTTIAAQQLQKLLQYKAVCLMDRPISTSFTETRSCDTDSTNDKTEKKPATSNKKSVPEEAIPDLIRLVHGNPVGIKNLVKEFRMYWRKKTNPDLDTTADVTLDSSKLDMSMDVDEKAENNKDSPKPTGLETPKAKADDFAISKRQLEIKIPAIAVHEKRLSIKKLRCWYVKEEVLEQYNMKDIQLPNTWEYVGIKPPTWAMDKTVTPKVEDVSKVTMAKTGPDTPKIMKFAQPMSPSMIQALGPIAGNKDNPAADTSQVPNGILLDQLTGDQSRPESPNPLKAPLPADQRRIKDMFSPVARKSLKKITGSPKMSSPKMTTLLGQLPSDTNKIVSPVSKKLTNIKTTPSDVIPKPSTSLEQAPASSTNDETTPKKGPVQAAPAGKLKVSPKASDRKVPVLKSILSSPELMKPTVAEESKTDDLASKEQPMDVDIIVID